MQKSPTHSGITLLEVTIASVIFITVVIMMSLSISSLLKRQQINNQVSLASSHLQHQAEQLQGVARTQAYEQLANGGPYYLSYTNDAWQVETSPPPVAEYDTQIHILPAFTDSSGKLDPSCDAPNPPTCTPSANIKRAEITVDWSTNPGNTLTTTTFLSPQEETLIPTPAAPPINVNIGSNSGSTDFPELVQIPNTNQVYDSANSKWKYRYNLHGSGEYYVKTFGNSDANDVIANTNPPGTSTITQGPYTPVAGSRPVNFYTKIQFSANNSVVETDYPDSIFQCISNCNGAPPYSIIPWNYSTNPPNYTGDPLYVDMAIDPINTLTNVHYQVIDHADAEEDSGEVTETREIFFYEEGNLSNRYHTVSIPTSPDITSGYFTLNEPGNTNNLMLHSIDSALIWINKNVPPAGCDLATGDC